MTENWRSALTRLHDAAIAHILVTVTAADGSAPREAGVKMVVTADAFFGTIGGGTLEYEALKIGRQMLADDVSEPSLRPFPLGPALGQCCGGAVELLFEPFLERGFNIVLFGAGHVGRALVPVLAGLDANIAWIDPREDQFPDIAFTNVAAHITVHIDDDPVACVGDAHPGSYFLVMTHAHDLDEEITAAILARNDFAYCGLIGSTTKAARFRTRFKRRGLTDTQIAGLTCPIGIKGLHGKAPAEIAISVAAQILQLRGPQGRADRTKIYGEATAKVGERHH